MFLVSNLIIWGTRLFCSIQGVPVPPAAQDQCSMGRTQCFVRESHTMRRTAHSKPRCSVPTYSHVPCQHYWAFWKMVFKKISLIISQKSYNGNQTWQSHSGLVSIRGRPNWTSHQKAAQPKLEDGELALLRRQSTEGPPLESQAAP